MRVALSVVVLSLCIFAVPHLVDMEVVLGAQEDTTQPPDQEDTTEPPDMYMSTQVDAVLLDLIVRGEDGRPVRDLRMDEIRIFEDDVEQTIKSFRSRRDSMTGSGSDLDKGLPPDLVERPDESTVNPFKNINLISLVFDRLSLYGRQYSRRGGIDFLDAGIGENTLVSVFIIDHRLHIIQPFTRDVDALKAGVERATSGAFSSFASESEAIALSLRDVAGASASGEAAVAGTGRGGSSAGIGAQMADAAMAEMQLSMLQRSEELMREQQGIATIHSLLALVGEQRALAGRKTVMLFSEGIHAPPDLVDRFHFAISEANKANVTIYAFDARGLNPEGQMAGASAMLGRAVGATRRQLLVGLGKATTREQVMAMENAAASLRMNVQGTLAELAEGTGGFLTANTNDVRPSVRRLQEDLQIYYEISYSPTNRVYDGSYRQIRVEVDRQEVTVQSRKGYFAMPVTSDGPPVFPYEVPMLAALSSNPLPREFDYRGRALRFGRAQDYYQYSIVMEVPLNNFTFLTDSESQTYSTRFSLMAVVEDMDGRVVRKVSQDYPLQGPLDRLEGMKKSEVVFVRELYLPPGKFRLELVAHDKEANRSSARRSYLFVPPFESGLSISNISVIRRIDPVSPTEDNTNPFIVETGKIVPSLAGTIQKDGGELSLFLVLYPSGAGQVNPSLTFQFLRNGEVFGQAALELPYFNGESKIPYVATLPIEDLEPGQYEVRAVASQGPERAVEHSFFTIEM